MQNLMHPKSSLSDAWTWRLACSMEAISVSGSFFSSSFLDVKHSSIMSHHNWETPKLSSCGLYNANQILVRNHHSHASNPPLPQTTKLLSKCPASLSPLPPTALSVQCKQNWGREQKDQVLQVPRRTRKRREQRGPCQRVKNERYVRRALPGRGRRLTVASAALRAAWFPWSVLAWRFTEVAAKWVQLASVQKQLTEVCLHCSLDIEVVLFCPFQLFNC